MHTIPATWLIEQACTSLFHTTIAVAVRMSYDHYCEKISWFVGLPPYEIVKPYGSRTVADQFLDMSIFASNFLRFWGAARQPQDSRKADP